MKKIATLAATLALCAAAPSVASAAYWEYYGWLPNGYDANCIWYATSAQCSGWNYWQTISLTVYSGGPVLNGFENYSTIRGRWTYGGQYSWTSPSSLGMSSYSKAQETNYTGVTAWISGSAAG